MMMMIHRPPNLALRFSPFGNIKRITGFPPFELCFETYAGCIFSFLAYKILRATVKLFFSNSFQSFFSDGKFLSFQLYLFIKGLVFVILCRSFLFLYNLTRLLQRIESIYYLFCAFLFLPNQENLYMIQHNLDLFSDIYNTITNIIEDKLTTSHQF